LKDDPFTRKPGLQVVEEKQVLRVSQDAFEEAVRENMELFALPAEQALEETIKEFELQKVDLSNIAKRIPGQEHPVLSSLESLKALVAPRSGVLLGGAKMSSLVAPLAALRDATLKSSENRNIAADAVAADYVLSALQAGLKENNAAIIEAAVGALSSIVVNCRKSQDRAGSLGVQSVAAALRLFKGDQTSQEALRKTFLCIRSLGVKNEANRQMLDGEGVYKEVIGLLPKVEKPLLKDLSKLIRSLLFDDDVKVLVAKAHNRALEMVDEGAIKHIMSLLWNSSTKTPCAYDNIEDVQLEVMSLLSRLMVKDEFCVEAVQLGALDLAVHVLNLHVFEEVKDATGDSMKLERHALSIIKAVAGNDDNKVLIAEGPALQATVKLMSTVGLVNIAVGEASAGVVGAIGLRSESNSQRVLESGGIEALIRLLDVAITVGETKGEAAMKSKMSLCRTCCQALRNLVGRNVEVKEKALALGAEEKARKAWQMYGDYVGEAAHPCLRDMGCEVELRELWTGSVDKVQDSSAVLGDFSRLDTTLRL